MRTGPQPMLDVTTTVRQDGTLLVVPRGEVDAATVVQLTGALEAALAGAGVVVLDLRELNFMDSSGLRAVITAADRARRAHDAGFFVVRGPRRIQRVFDLARVEERISWLDDPAELTAPD